MELNVTVTGVECDTRAAGGGGLEGGRQTPHATLSEAGMDSQTQAQLAALIMRDMQQLKERAERKSVCWHAAAVVCCCHRCTGSCPPAHTLPFATRAGEGVTAYLSRPVQRERPNQRFLVNTLKSVQQANRRAEEEEMWAQRAAQREREAHEHKETRGRQRVHNWERDGSQRRHSRSRGSSRSRAQRSSHNDDGSGATAAVAPVPAPGPAAAGVEEQGQLDEGGLGDEAVAAMLAARRPRGRGALGSRMDEAGPYAQAPGGQELENEDVVVIRRIPVGPSRPEWLQAKLNVLGQNRSGAAAAAASRTAEEDALASRLSGDSSSSTGEGSGGRWRNKRSGKHKRRRSRSSSRKRGKTEHKDKKKRRRKERKEKKRRRRSDS